MPDRIPIGAIRSGNALATPVQSRMLTGSVLEYFSGTHTYRVRTEVGELSEVPRIARDNGDVVVLPPDTVVVLHNELGYWVIDGVLKQTPVFAKELNRVSVSELQGVGGEDPQNAQSTRAASFRGAGDPKDLLGADWVRHSGDGNFIGVLSGGMNVMQSAPFAQVRTHAATNSVEVIAHEYRHRSAMGDLDIVNDGGKTSLIWRAGSDQSTETGANTGNWTIRLDVGAEGNVLRFRTTTPQGQTLSEFHISPEGKVSVVGMGGVDVSAADYREDVLGDKTAVVAGALVETVAGGSTVSVGGARSTQVGQNEELSVGGGQAVSISGNSVLTIGGSLTQSVGASSRVDVTSGYLDLVLGDPAKLGTEAGTLSFVNHKGDIQAKPSEAGKFTAFGTTELGASAIPTPRPDGSIGNSSAAPYSAMLFEMFNSMMTTLLNWMDTHTHGSAMGPTTPPVVPSTPVVNPQLSPIQSQKVKLGG